MRVLQIHNRYLRMGGEDTVLESEASLLRSNGHDVFRLEETNTRIAGAVSKIKAAVATPFSWSSFEKVLATVKEIRPDVVHVHNTFPLLSPSIFDACKIAGIPVVATLHNYRYFCANGVRQRDGVTCNKCLDGSAVWGLVHGCYRGSRAATLPITASISISKARKLWSKKVDRFIALSNHSRKQFVLAGIPESKIEVKPNFVGLDADATLSDVAATGRSGALFVGRLHNEKGIITLLDAWDELDVPLTIIGEGPLLGEIAQRRNPNIRVGGWLDKRSVLAEMHKAEFVVVPSTCEETFGLVAIEAFSVGTPVIASRLGGLPEVVEDKVAGLVFDPGNPGDLRSAVKWAISNPMAMRDFGLAAKKIAECRYGPAANYQRLIEIYHGAIRDANTGSM